MTHTSHNPRQSYGISLFATLAIGVATQFVEGASLEWIARHLGGTFYVLLWIFLTLTAFPKWRAPVVCAAALFATILVECAQLSHPAWLEAIRSTRPGRLLLGSDYDWMDFPYYGLGYLVGLVWTRCLTGPRLED
ncbi:MAG: DUF2809 domain-containing protein [bacterium]|nr:DUF2809 domain-containing protein [bacterium]